MSKPLVENETYEKILNSIQTTWGLLQGLWTKPGGGKNVDPSEAIEIATALLPELRMLVTETESELKRLCRWAATSPYDYGVRHRGCRCY
jgi:hypothetical protein